MQQPTSGQQQQPASRRHKQGPRVPAGELPQLAGVSLEREPQPAGGAPRAARPGLDLGREAIEEQFQLRVLGGEGQL